MENTEQHSVLLQANHVSKWYGDEKTKKVILSSMSLSIHENEFVALLGPSGSGKSTFLRTLAGLISPSEGQVLTGGEQLLGPNPSVAIVFQNFALYPWLTVEKNVELGLTAVDISKSEKEKRVAEAIQLIGLRGFESAYPKEISGGMKQRVGFARALVVQPEILMMDEPFSALDVLTAESLRHELLSLWQERKIPTKAILMVTHNIDEAVSMADRLLVLSANPGRVRVEIPGLAVEKRSPKSPDHIELVDNIYKIMTNPHVDPERLVGGITRELIVEEESPYQIIPQVTLGSLKGFLRLLASNGGKQDMKILEQNISIDEMLPLVQLIDILDFGGIEGSNIVLTEIGGEFASANGAKGKLILHKQLLENLSLIQFIMKQLQESPKHELRKKNILQHLKQYFSPQDATLQFKTAINLGVHAELFSYDNIHERCAIK